MAVQQLSATRAHALFDILTHYEAYAEIEALKESQSIDKFGVPLQPETPQDSSSPLIQILLQRFFLVLPGIRDVSPEFWTQNIKGLATALDDATLSESYDKGSIGIRKTISTAIASIIEYVSRGCLGGYPRHSSSKEREYDTANPDDVIDAWDEFLQQIIYGDMLDVMFDKAAETDKLSDHGSLVQAAHEYALVILGSFLHYILIISPRGQSILPLLTKAHNLAPYFLIRQTLRVGNAATMINGMVKLILTKINMSTVTIWFGGQGSDSGMNLLQQIISQILSGDSSELRKRAKAIEHDKAAPSKEHLTVLREYGAKSVEEQQSIRGYSETEPDSIALAVLSNTPNLGGLSETQQKLALEYLAVELAIRDREELIKVLCHSSPDLLTSSIRTIIPAYDSIIRALHNAADLSGGVLDLEAFLNDLIKVSTVDGKAKRSPSAEDYCRLLHKHQGSSHKFIHQVLKNAKELSEWYHEYGAHAAKQYRQETRPYIKTGEIGAAAAGDFTQHLEDLVSSLSDEERANVMNEVDSYSDYLASISEASTTSMTTIIRNVSDGKSETQRGPGMFLSRWQSLMDETPITPATANGPVRSGKNDSVRHATTTDVDGESKGDASNIGKLDGGVMDPPNVDNTIRLLGPKFKAVLRGLVEKG